MKCEDTVTLQALRSELQALADGLKSEIGQQINAVLEVSQARVSSTPGLPSRQVTSQEDAPPISVETPKVNSWVAKRREARVATVSSKSRRSQKKKSKAHPAYIYLDPLEREETLPIKTLTQDAQMFLIPKQPLVEADGSASSASESCRSLVVTNTSMISKGSQIGQRKHNSPGNAKDSIGENLLHGRSGSRGSGSGLEVMREGVGNEARDEATGVHSTQGMVLRRPSIDFGGGGNSESSSDEELVYHGANSKATGCCSRVLNVFSKCIRSELFAEICCFVVLGNAICVGVEAHYMAVYWTEELPGGFEVCEKIFCVFFSIEITLRFLSSGWHHCCAGAWRWNLFDLCATCMQWAGIMYDFQFGKVLQLVRLVRIVRVLRVFRSVGELRMLMASILHSLKTFGWVMVLLCLTIYIVAVYLTMEVTKLKVQRLRRSTESANEREIVAKELENMLAWFGSLDRSMLTLYATVAEGIHWEELMEPLADHISPWMRLLFFCFSAVALFAVMNAITGVFVESAIHSATEDKKHAIANQMRKMFKRADGDGSGDITWEEFKDQVQSPEVAAALHEVDLDPEDARELFRLLDVDNSGTVDITELVHGSYRLMGQAKSLDLAILMHEFRRIAIHQQEQWQTHSQFVQKCLIP